ncbi:hypothetical protein [Parendozoicomonas sp. Alg238-R29]|uniref:hypothetical protein n=1 Tax=Parendozoicomonas sp. Alg238-R29 TaxID=2993446 RepID=UPI00248ED6B2|nr:hypothetical protein [Parendozoicomonas sp. Alg238-R29]
MSINVETVRGILEGGGKVAFSNNQMSSTMCESVPIRPAAYGVYDNFRMAKAAIGDNIITMTGTKSNDRTANAIKIEYDDNYACCGSIGAPSFIYSDGFSGCEFHLYRGPLNYIHAVHASRASKKLADPTDYFTKRGGTRIYRWDSLGAIPDELLMKYCTGAVLAVVNRNQIDVFALAIKDQVVHSVIQHDTVQINAAIPA